MRKFKILGALVAVLAFSAFAVAGASATLWLNPTTKESLLEAKPAQSHGTIILLHTVLTVLTEVECKGLFDGTVGPGALDLVELVLGASGEQDLVTCKVIKGSAGTCGVGSLVLVHALNLPWKTELRLEGSLTWDYFLEDGTHGLPGYDVLCGTTLVADCTGNVRAHFDLNLANGALFLWLDKESLVTKCSDGGEGSISQPSNVSSETLLWIVS